MSPECCLLQPHTGQMSRLHVFITFEPTATVEPVQFEQRYRVCRQPQTSERYRQVSWY